MQKTLRLYLFPILTGFLVGTSYIPFPPWALLFCLAPLILFCWEETSYKRIFFGAWISQFVLNFIGFHWIAHTVVEFGRLPLAAGLGTLLLFCTIAHLYYPIAFVLWKLISDKLKFSPVTAFLFLPPLFVLCERLYPMIFYWHLGYPWLWGKLPGLQLADTIGFLGLNLLTIYINVLLGLFFLNRKKGEWLRPEIILAAGLFVSINVWGYFHGKNLVAPDKSLKVLVVQGNIGNLEKIQAEEGSHYIKKIVDTYLELTRQGLAQNPGVELVIWPETAFPEVLHPRYKGVEQRRIIDLTSEFDVHLLTGAYMRKKGSRKAYNGLILMEGDEIIGSYQKTVLLAFGEYLPFGEVFPQLKAMLPMVSDFGRGEGPTVIPWSKARIGAQICYEGLFDDFSTDLQTKGSQVFINLTNDSWFGYPFEPYQHMYMTLARAIENRRPLVRVTNTGITTSIMSDGQVLPFSPRNKKWFKSYDISFHSTPPATFYARISHNWSLILLGMMLLVTLGDRIARTGKY